MEEVKKIIFWGACLGMLLIIIDPLNIIRGF